MQTPKKHYLMVKHSRQRCTDYSNGLQIYFHCGLVLIYIVRQDKFFYVTNGGMQIAWDNKRKEGIKHDFTIETDEAGGNFLTL